MFSWLIPKAQAACDTTANGTIDLGSCLTLKSGQSVSDVYNNPSVLVNLVVSNLFVVAGVFIFLMLIFAGVKFSMQGTSKAKDEAKSIATSAGLGFIVMFCAYWVIQIVELITGAPILF